MGHCGTAILARLVGDNGVSVRNNVSIQRTASAVISRHCHAYTVVGMHERT